jgi:hypothetical protein
MIKFGDNFFFRKNKTLRKIKIITEASEDCCLIYTSTIESHG